MLTLILATAILALPLLAGRHPLSTKLGVAAFAWLLLTGLHALQVGVFAPLSLPGSTGGSLHDTYYVVGHFHYQLSLAAVLAVLALIAWLAGLRYGFATLVFWAMHVALALGVLPTQFATRLLVDTSTSSYLAQAERLETLNTISTIASVTALLALALLGILILISLVQRLFARR